MNKAPAGTYDPAATAERANAALAKIDNTKACQILWDAAHEAGMAEVSARSGYPRNNLYAALAKHGNPQLHTLLVIAEALGLGIKFFPLS